MIPASAPSDTRSDAERRIFEAIRTGLNDQWTAIHSLGMTRHGRKPWAEIDFVIIGPKGLFCMEVKGGIISRRNGEWFTTPLHGENRGVAQRLKESPFEQAGSASAALFKQIEMRFHGARQHLMSCYCVGAPDCEWDRTGIDFEADLVYDRSSTMAPFATFVERIAEYWKERFNTSALPLGASDRDSLVKLLAGDFNLAPSLRFQAEAAFAELVRLTKEQADIFGRLDETPRVVASGGAGTGKTFLAAAEARRLAEAGERPLFLCFSKNLAAYLQEALADESLVTVRTLHSLMYEIVNGAGRLEELPDAEDEDIYGTFLPLLCLEVLESKRSEARWTALIVDEGQDLLSSTYLDVLDHLVVGGLDGGVWRWFFDPNQDLFGGIAEGSIRSLASRGAAVWKLTTNCRNTAPIADRVAMLAGMDKGPVLSAEGPPVDLIWWDTPEDQRMAVSDEITSLVRQGIAPEQITVLSHRTLKRSCIAEGLVSSRLEVVDVSRGGIAQRQVGALSFSTISSFKGLESDVVIVVDVDDLAAPHSLAQVYVGTSRARIKLVVALNRQLEGRLAELAGEFGRRLADR